MGTTTRPDETRPSIPSEWIAETEALIDRVMKGIRDPEEMRKAAERMDRTREEVYRRVGLLDFAVPTIRALREGDDE
jgi:hypothetical protein